MFYLMKRENIVDYVNKEDMLDYLNDFVNESDENINDFIIIEGEELYPLIKIQDMLTQDDFHKKGV